MTIKFASPYRWWQKDWV